MNRVFYFFLAVFFMAGCGSSKEKMNETGISGADINPSAVKISIVAGTGRVEPEGGIVSLAAPSGGIVTEICRDEGDSVAMGDPVIRLEDKLEQIRVSQLISQVAAQRAQVESDRLMMEDAVNKLANRQRYLESTKELAGKGAETPQNLDDLETDVRSLAITAENAKVAVEMSESRLRDLQAQERYARQEADEKTILAPSDGILLSMDARKGSSISQLSSFADFAPAGKKIVRAEIDELFADRLSEGLKANIRYAGSDSTIATGNVFFVSPYLKKKSLFSQRPDDQEDRLVREVKISMDNANDLILNSKVECVITLKDSRP